MPIHSSKPAGRHGRQLALQLDEILLEIRKAFGMHGRTSWHVQHVGPDVITVRFDHWPPHVPILQTATRVRNAMLNLLGDTVPSARFRAVFRRADRPGAHRRVELAFHPPGAPDLPGPLIVIEENVQPRRRHWRALVERAGGSEEYFARGRTGRSP